MLAHCTDITDRLIVLMFSSGGFRLEAWDYFCWKDVILLPADGVRGGEKYRGAALRMYRGDLEKYWTATVHHHHHHHRLPSMQVLGRNGHYAGTCGARRCPRPEGISYPDFVVPSSQQGIADPYKATAPARLLPDSLWLDTIHAVPGPK